MDALGGEPRGWNLRASERAEEEVVPSWERTQSRGLSQHQDPQSCHVRLV